MTRQTEAKQERIIEAVRQGFDGGEIVEFVHQNGYALTDGTLERHLRKMGGLPRLQVLLDEGLTNVQVLEQCMPEENLRDLKVKLQLREVGAKGQDSNKGADSGEDVPIYATTKITLTLPSDLYEALRAAAHAEMKSQNRLITELLTEGLSNRPHLPNRKR